MTAFAQTQTAPAAPRAGFGRLLHKFQAWNLRRVTRRELSKLDDTILRDIGLPARGREPGFELLVGARSQW